MFLGKEIDIFTNTTSCDFFSITPDFASPPPPGY